MRILKGTCTIHWISILQCTVCEFVKPKYHLPYVIQSQFGGWISHESNFKFGTKLQSVHSALVLPYMYSAYRYADFFKMWYSCLTGTCKQQVANLVFWITKISWNIKISTSSQQPQTSVYGHRLFGHCPNCLQTCQCQVLRTGKLPVNISTKIAACDHIREGLLIRNKKMFTPTQLNIE